MAGGEIKTIPKIKSVAIEFFFKPAAFSAAIFAAAWMSWASRPIAYNHVAIGEASREACGRIWAGNQVMAWKMGLFAHVLACFLEADNAYSVWWREFVKIYAKKTGGFYDETNRETEGKTAEKGAFCIASGKKHKKDSYCAACQYIKDGKTRYRIKDYAGGTTSK